MVTDYAAFCEHLRWYHQLKPEDVVPIADVKGYWRVLTPCPGGDNCRHAFRGALGACTGGELTVSFAQYDDQRDSHGRYLSPFREWRRQVAALGGKESE